MLIEKVSSQEKRIIDIFRHNNSASEDTDFFTGSFVDCDTFLQYWEGAKLSWAQVFKDTLIFKKNIRVAVEEDDLYNELNNLRFSESYQNFVKRLSSIINHYNPEAEIIISRPWGEVPYRIMSFLQHFIFDTDLWLKNIYEGPLITLNMPNSTSYKLTPGCKIMKIIGKLTNLADDAANLSADFEEIRLKHSRIMNEAVLDATLCISIHPLDYITASYNANNWRSCMCWEDGEYRRGVIEMMNSPYVVVAYLESKKENLFFYESYNTHKMTWNSKKWREFFIVSPEIITGIKGYPYWNKEVEAEALKMIKDLFSSIYPQYKDINTISEFSPDEGYVNQENNSILKIRMYCGPAMYNDFYGDHPYQAYIPEATKNQELLHIFYSGESECVCCGRTTKHDYIEFDGEGELVCNNCIEHYTCCKCGDIIHYENDLFEFHDRYYCRYCYDNLLSCDYCGDTIDEDNDLCLTFTVGKIYDSDTNIILRNLQDHPHRICVCDECSKKVFVNQRRELYEPHPTYSDWFNYLPIITFDKITEYGLSVIDPDELEKLKQKIDKNESVLDKKTTVEF